MNLGRFTIQNDFVPLNDLGARVTQGAVVRRNELVARNLAALAVVPQLTTPAHVYWPHKFAARVCLQICPDVALTQQAIGVIETGVGHTNNLTRAIQPGIPQRVGIWDFEFNLEQHLALVPALANKRAQVMIHRHDVGLIVDTHTHLAFEFKYSLVAAAQHGTGGVAGSVACTPQQLLRCRDFTKLLHIRCARGLERFIAMVPEECRQ